MINRHNAYKMCVMVFYVLRLSLNNNFCRAQILVDFTGLLISEKPLNFMYLHRIRLYYEIISLQII